MIYVVKRKHMDRWEIAVNGEFHGHYKSKIDAQRAAVKKINSTIIELEGDRKRLTNEILAAT